MSEYKVGQARVLSANHSRVKLSSGSTATITVGSLFKFQGESQFKTVALIVDADELDLDSAYSGAIGYDTDAPYAIVLDFTPNLGVPELSPGDVDIRDVYTRAMRRIDALLAGHRSFSSGVTELVEASADTTRGLVVRGYSGTQSADLLQVRKSDDTVLFTVAAAGHVGVGIATPSSYLLRDKVLAVGSEAAGTAGQVAVVGNRTTDAVAGEITFFNGANRVAGVVVSRSNANNSGKIDLGTAVAGSYSARITIDRDAVTIAISSGTLGFYSATPVAKQTVTGSRGANAALASLMTALANLGLVTDSTS